MAEKDVLKNLTFVGGAAAESVIISAVKTSWHLGKTRLLLGRIRSDLIFLRSDLVLGKGSYRLADYRSMLQHTGSPISP